MACTKVAVVTGSNKGIGLSTVKRLCKDFQGDVILTARDKDRGAAAVDALRKEGLSPKFHQLDIEDKQSVENLRDFLSQQYGGLDVLVNNAAIAFKAADTTSFSEQAERSIAVNFTDTLNVFDTLCPLLRPHARVVYVASRVSSYAYEGSNEAIQKRMTTCNTVEQVKQLLADFVQSAKNNKVKESGFPETAYGMSKVGIVLVTRMQQELLDKDSRQDIVVNCCCPGIVSTDMSSHHAKGKPVDEGADMPVYLSLLPENVKTPRGQFIAEGKPVDFTVPFRF